MSMLLDVRWQAFDSSGNPLVGATLTVYNTGTFVLASIYRDSARAVPMTNPTSGGDKSDAAGRFPQIFAAEAAVFDVLLKDSLGNTVASYVNVVGLGADSGSVLRDFTNSRYSVRGSGGTVYIEAGDPTGDNVGGTMRLGGWLGTQADLITIDTALLNVTGKIKENSKKIPSVVYTEATAITAVNSYDIALPNDPAGVRGYEIELWDYSQSGGGNLLLLASFDGGSTYKAGASDYHYGGISSIVGTGVASIGSASGVANMLIAGGSMVGLSNRSGRIKISITTPDSGTEDAVITSRADGCDTSGNPMTFLMMGHIGASYGRVDHVRLFITGGVVTMTAKFLLRPIRGMGET